MRNLALFGIFSFVIIIAVVIGSRQVDTLRTNTPVASTGGMNIPSIGRIQILNGCGVIKCAETAADVVRAHGFDVKSDGIGNATGFNYPFTLVISRVREMTVARQLGAALMLPVDRVILMRTGDERFDATIILGPDYPEVLARAKKQ